MGALSKKPILQEKYKLLKELQKLPYSTYYLGMSIHRPEERWAVKKIKLEFDTQEERAGAFLEFERTAKKYLKIDHPLFIPLSDCFYESDYEYIIFKFIPGHRLQEILDLRKEPFNEFQVIDLAWQVADALGYLHSRQMIFHDLNPSNIIITPEGSIKLTDYGLGKVLAKRDSRQPKWGSAGYAPPEQYGDNAALHEGIDVYALGVVMHQMLTFRDPATSKGALPPVRKLNPEISQSVEALIMNAAEPDCGKRYPTIKDFISDLEKIKFRNHNENDEEIEESWLLKLVKELTKPFKKGIKIR